MTQRTQLLSALGDTAVMEELRKDIAFIEEAAEKENPDIMGVLNSYLALRTGAYQADQRLLAACQSLTKIIFPLHKLAKVLE
jgi:hypothetical protein